MKFTFRKIVSRALVSSSKRFLVSIVLLFVFRTAEFMVDYIKGDGDGAFTSPIGLIFNLIYVIFIFVSTYNLQSVISFLNNKSSIVFLIIFTGLLAFLTLRGGHGWGDDFGLYIAQAKVICSGGMGELKIQQDYTQVNSEYYLGPNFYPWGFPAIIAPVYYFFGLNLTALKIVSFIWLSFSLFLLYYWFKDALKNMTFYLLSFLAFMPLFFSYRDEIGSDIPFVFFSLLGLYYIQRVVSFRLFFFNEIADLLLIGLLIFVTYSIRSIGIVLLPTLLATQAYAFFIKSDINRIKITRQFIPYVVFIILIILYNSVTGYSDNSYASQFDWTNIYYQFQFRFFYYLNTSSDFFNAPVLGSLSSLIWGVYFFFFIFGVIRMKGQDFSLAVYVFFTFCIVIIYRYQANRFFFSILPLILYFVLNGCDYLQNKLNTQNISGVLFFPVIIFFSYGTLLQSVDAILKMDTVIEGPFDEESIELISFVENETKKDDIIIFFKPRILRLLTGRNGFVVNSNKSIHDGRADYLIIHKNTINDQFPLNEDINLIASNNKVFENVDFIAFKLK